MTPGGREETSVPGGAAFRRAPGRGTRPAPCLRSLLDLLDQALVWCEASGAVSGFNRPAARLFPRLRVGEVLGPAAGPMATAFARGDADFDASFEGRRLVGRRETCEGHAVWLVSDLGAPGEREDAPGESPPNDADAARDDAGTARADRAPREPTRTPRTTAPPPCANTRSL